MPNHTVTISVAASEVNFSAGTKGPSSISVSLINEFGVPIASTVASGSPLTAVFNDVPDGTYTMTATTQQADGSPIPTLDAGGNAVTGSVTGTVVVSDPPVSMLVATGITATIS